jgi:hypothetical protein
MTAPMRCSKAKFSLTVKPTVALPLPEALSKLIQLTVVVAVHPHVPDVRLTARLDCVAR